MKRIIKSLTVAAMLSMAFAGCHREKMGFDSDGGTGAGSGADEFGYITFDGGIVVEWDGENVNMPTDGEKANTRASQPDVDNFTVTINRVAPDTQSAVVEDTFANLQAKPYIELLRRKDNEECKYQVVVTSGGEMKDAAYDDEEGQPTYRGELAEPFVIESDYSTPDHSKQMSNYEIICKLESVKVSVSLEKSMAELATNASFEVSNSPVRESLVFDDGAHRFGVANLREDHTFAGFADGKSPSCGYLKPINEAGDALTLKMTMDYRDQHISQEIEVAKDAKANQYRRILLYVTEDESGSGGHIVVYVTVETWTYGEEVVVDVTEQAVFASEPTLPNPDVENPDAPTISSDLFVAGGVTEIGASDYENGVYQGSATVNIATKNGEAAKSFTVQLDSDNAEFKSGSYSPVVGKTVELTGSGIEQIMLQSLGFPQSAQIAAGGELSFDLANLLNAISGYEGTYKVTLSVTDSDGNVSTVVLTVNYTSEGGGNNGSPSIVWPGHDFNNRYEITDDLVVNIHIEAPAGIEHFYVKMEGSIANALGGDLPDFFDLVEPEEYQEGLSDVLTNDLIGFPVGNDVKGQTKMDFDITKFMGMLQGVTEEWSNFTLEIEDSKGQSAKATLKLNVTK